MRIFAYLGVSCNGNSLPRCCGSEIRVTGQWSGRVISTDPVLSLVYSKRRSYISHDRNCVIPQQCCTRSTGVADVRQVLVSCSCVINASVTVDNDDDDCEPVTSRLWLSSSLSCCKHELMASVICDVARA